MSSEPFEVKVLSGRKVAAFFAMAVAAIIAAVALSGCGNDSEPTEQSHHESAAAAPSAPPEAAAAAPDPGELIGGGSGNDQAEAAAPDPDPAPVLYKASCYAGANEVIGINNLADDSWEFDGNRYKFLNVDGKGDVYFNGVCIVRAQ